MPQSTQWYQPYRIVLSTLSGIVSYDDIQAIAQTLTTLANEHRIRTRSPETTAIHTILDRRAVEKYDFNMMQLASLLKTYQESVHTNNHLMIVSQTERSNNIFASLFQKVSGLHLKYVGSIEEALDYLYSVDTTLEPSV